MMKSTGLIAILLFALLHTGFAQQKTAAVSQKKGTLYFGFGTNRSFYGKSDIHLKASGNPNFDIVLNNVRAKDDEGLKFNNGGAVQYSYQLGYYFRNKNFGIEFNFDHIKYFVRQNQVVRLTGTINNVTYDRDTTLTPGFIQFEHSDGGNYALLNFVKWKNLFSSANKKNGLDLVLKAGAGPVVPKTNSTIMGRHYDDRYKISGYVVALEGGLRYHFLKNFFVVPSFKGAYANYTNFVIAQGEGKQKWIAGHFNLLVGGQVSF